MPKQDFTYATHYALGGLGYGKGFTPEEAVENYVATQLRNFRASDTVFKTRKAFEAALRTGELAPDVWAVPDGTVGFVSDHEGLHWRVEVDGEEGSVPAAVDQIAVKSPQRQQWEAEDAARKAEQDATTEWLGTPSIG